MQLWEQRGRHDAQQETGCIGQSKTNEIIVMQSLKGACNGDNKSLCKTLAEG